MSSDIVKLKFNENNDKLLAYWPSSNVPIEPKFIIDEKNNVKRLIVNDHVQFVSDDSCNEGINYFIGVKGKKGKLICQPVQLHRMLSIYNVQHENNKKVELSKKEQLDELKEKFGSKKTQRDLANKRKYEIQFGEEDADNLPTVDPSQINKEIKDIDLNQDNDETAQPLSSILPKRNVDTNLIEEVYSLNDIITVEEKTVLTNYHLQLLSRIENEYIQKLVEKHRDVEHQIMAIYADLLLKLVKLKATDMRKSDPMPTVIEDIKKLLFNRYTSDRRDQSSRSVRYVITDQNKDRIFVYICLLIIMLHNYKPIELESLQEAFKLKQPYVRRLLELIGCYLENMKSVNGTNVKVAVLKLPLNVYKEPKAKRLRR